MSTRVLALLLFFSLCAVAGSNDGDHETLDDEQSESSSTRPSLESPSCSSLAKHSASKTCSDSPYCTSRLARWLCDLPEEGSFEKEWGACGVCGQSFNYHVGDNYTRATLCGPVGCCGISKVTGTATTLETVDRIGPGGCLFDAESTRDECHWSVLRGCLMNYHEWESQKPLSHRFQCAPCGVCFEHRKTEQATECDFFWFLFQGTENHADQRMVCKACLIPCYRENQ